MNTFRPARRALLAAAAAGSTGLALSSCGSSKSDDAIASKAPSVLEGTVSFWHFFNGDRETAVMQSAVDSFTKAHPKVKVDVHAGQDDEKLQKAISSGQPIDLALSYSASIVGSFTTSGAFRDLGPYIKRDGVDLDDIPASVRSYTEFKGARATLPVLADVTALYFNRKLLAAAGIAEPPKTLDELHDAAHALTVLRPDGSIQQLGFNPMMGFYENTPETWSPMIDGAFLTKDGKSAFGTSEGWKRLIEWQKAFIDEIGYDKLNAFTSGLGQEFSSENAFMMGKVAMEIDGEYRTAFIADQHPDLDYGTAPTPVMEGTGTYGAGFITGNVAGIGKGAKEPELAWALLKHLALDTDTQVALANGLKNIPTTLSALKSPQLQVDDNYRTFIDIAQGDSAMSSPGTEDGASYVHTIETFWQQYQSAGGDLPSQLKKVDSDIDSASKLSGP